MTFRSGGLWRKAYELDFTVQSALNIRTGGDGAKVIDGKTWTWANDASVASADIVPGTGLVIVANATVTGYYEGGATRTAATLTLPVSSAINLFDINQNSVRVLARMTLTGADADTEGGKLFMEHVSAPASQNASIAKWFTGGSLGFQTNESHDPTYTTPYPNNPVAPADDILALVFVPNDGWQGYSGLYAAGDKMRLRTQRGSFIQTLGTTRIGVAADVRLGLCQVTNNAAAALTTTFTHLRVDFDDRHPAV